ncbi:MAG: ABC transporter ATP-binding protein [Nostocaceae cyanobacterium]|nr:ABC transporter ATP-binding protein [Nostocaceae cyanobacterium]
MLNYLSKFLYILKDKKKTLLLLILVFLLTSILETLGIGLIGPFIGLSTNPQFIHQNYWLNLIYTQSRFPNERLFISVLGLLIIFIFYIKSFISFCGQSFVFKFSFRQLTDLRTKLLHAYLSVPYTFHLSTNTALLIQNITDDANTFSTAIMIPLLSSTANVIVILFLSFLLIQTSPAAVIAILCILLFAFIPIYWFRNKVSAWGKEASQASTDVIRTINHSLGGLKETRVIGCEDYFESEITNHAKRYATSVSAYLSFSIVSRIVVETLLVTFIVGFISIFLVLTERNPQELSSLVGVFGLASIRLLPAISNSSSAIGTLKNNSYSLNKLYVDLKELEKLKSAKFKQINTNGTKNQYEVMPFEHEIILNKINYRYPSATENSISNIVLNIKKGQSIAFIGKSGAGKTTLIDIILGLLIPENGDIQVDGISVYENLRLWQNMIGYIPQSIFLMDDTIEKNIAFGVPDDLIDSGRMQKAVKAAQLDDLIQQLPDGLKTSVGERGVRLSGGQRQRVGIARALYHEREVLVLDEATAALDNETESLVNEAIKSLSGKKTILIIAHRLTTVEHCDYIYLMDKGRIIKSGTYQDVVLGSIPVNEIDNP